MDVVAEGLRLNLGCRTRVLDGWKNFDCDQHPGVDVVGDIRNLSMFADNSVLEIMASHCAEHVPHLETLSMLKEWHRVLEPSGKLYIAVPDFERAVQLYGMVGLDEWIVRFLCGDQEYKTAYHYNLFDEARLTALLKEAGFSESFRVDLFPLGDPADCSTNVSNIDGLPVSLNMIAVKGGA